MSFIKRSPWILHYDGSSCNGCDIETIACLTPVYDIERLGVLNMGNPKHADILLITGAINEQNKNVVRNIHEQMPEAKVVVAIGTCATSGGIFAECYNTCGGVDKVIPVDIYVPGCAARPESIMDGITESLKILAKKQKDLEETASGLKEMVIDEAAAADVPAMLTLQKLVYQSEAEIYGDTAAPYLVQSPEELKNDLASMRFFRAMMNDKMIGSVRSFSEKGTCYISRLMVDHVYEHHGVGRALVERVEKHFGGDKRFEIFTFRKNKRNIIFFQGLGFRIFKAEKVSDVKEKVYMEKHGKAE